MLNAATCEECQEAERNDYSQPDSVLRMLLF
jgi:hypothetical protein